METLVNIRALSLRVAALLSVLMPVASAQFFSASGPGGAIPASGTGGGGSWPTALPPAPFISGVNVPVAVSNVCQVKIDNLNHTWCGDLQFVLFDPTGVGYTLMSRPGYDSQGVFGNDGDFTGGGPIQFVRAGAQPIPDVATTDIPPGLYSQHFGDPNGLLWPNGTNNIHNTSLSHISGPAGIWTLRMYDWEGGDSGSCTGWTLEGNGSCFQPPPPPPPINYCTAKVNSLGCTPTIGSSGVSSASSSSGFLLTSTNNRNGKSGLLFYGISGRGAVVFEGGLLCVRSPVRRTGGIFSGGTPPPVNDCTGVFSIDMNTFAQQTSPPLPLPELRVIGTVVDCQFWGRDPGYPFPNNASLSSGLEYIVLP